MLRHVVIVIAGKSFKQGQKTVIFAVSHGDGGVAPDTTQLGAAYGRSPESAAKLFRVHFGEPLKRRSYKAFAGLELRQTGGWRLAVPRANVLAGIATEHMTPHARGHPFVHCPT